MKWERKRSARILSLTLALCLCGAPEMLGGQTQSTSAPPASPSTGQNPPDLPDAPGTAPATQQDNNSPQNQNSQKPPSQPAQAPAGTGAAEAGPTAGGAGSRPAGMAIAPAKQHQVRSFLIKLGAIAGGAIAIGTVYALSRSSPSRPSGAK
ncbi:MAG TPA: hypothetical protein VJQ50_21890 [Terriglobales bacterium]|nr:hypothetical protein [Terriglobales bacterium]